MLGGIQSLRQALQQSQQQTEALQASITRTATSSGPLGLPPSSLQASDASGSQPQCALPVRHSLAYNLWLTGRLGGCLLKQGGAAACRAQTAVWS